MLPAANLRHQEALDCAKGQKAEAEFPFYPRSFDRAVMVRPGANLKDAGNPCGYNNRPARSRASSEQTTTAPGPARGRDQPLRLDT